MAEVNVEKRTVREEPESVSRHRLDRFGDWRGPSPLEWRGSDAYSASLLVLMRRIQEDMDRFIAAVSHGIRTSNATGWWSEAEVWEQNGKLIVWADLPGVDKSSIRAEVTDASLTIRGERRREREQEEYGIRRPERTYGSFCRSITLPEGVNPDQVRAEFRDAVLEVTVPVAENQRARNIPIEDRTHRT